MRAFFLMFVAGVVGCSSLRDVSRDHLLPIEDPPTVQLDAYRSVQDRDDGQDPELAVAAAMSGGGHRAANFAMGVLLALESFEADADAFDLLKEIDYLSTVSGGGFAAGVYMATLHDHLQLPGGRTGYSLAHALRRDRGRLQVNLERDYHDTVFGGLLCLRCLGSADAGDIFERKLDRYVLGAKYRDAKRSLTLRDVFRPAGSTEAVRLPYWVANATVYENGARFQFTPDMLSRYSVIGYTHHLKKRELDAACYDLPLAVGLKASASFPVAFPATTLRCAPVADTLNPYLHLMDGGLVDNMGYRTAIELLRQDRAKRKVLLIIDAYKGGSRPHSHREHSPAGTQVGYRIMNIALDSDHNRLDANICSLLPASDAVGQTPIEVITLSFDSLRPAPGRQDTAAMIALYHEARAVATSLNITRREQQLLMDAGRAAVAAQRDELIRHLLPLK
jgi:predicted acylesterase/phospholipase RssA